jgi:hypothetical protein
MLVLGGLGVGVSGVVLELGGCCEVSIVYDIGDTGS